MLTAGTLELQAKPLKELPVGSLPRHVAIIMDGNGRWAQQRSLPRTEGHRRGVEAVRRAVRTAADLGIRYLTLYSFSSENWSRPPSEVEYLFNLLRRFIHQDVADLHAQGVKVVVIGEREALAPDIRMLIDDTEALTRDNQVLTLVVAFNYGSRLEIARAAQAAARAVEKGLLRPEDITPQVLSRFLDTQNLPDPDLIIRTGGEQRLSNFLLWQGAYAELVFVDEHWPDFDREIFERARRSFLCRDRRFGGVVANALP